MAVTPWSASAQLIEQDQAAVNFPTITGAGQTIAILDTGIDYRHPALGGHFGPAYKVVGGWDFVDNDGNPLDTYGHGTHVAGVLAGNDFTRDGVRYRGVAPAAKLVALRIDSANDPVPDERIERALRWVINNRTRFGITVANISFGFGSYDKPETSPIFGDELKALRTAGVFVVASSGNNGVSDPPGIQYPAADPNVFAVGSVNASDTISEFTERGPTLDLLAPGQSIVALDVSDGRTGADYTTVSGTSFAAPLVAGAVALLKQSDPNLHAADIHSILRASGVDVKDGDNESGYTTNFTYPRLDLDAALKLVRIRQPGPLNGEVGGQPRLAAGNDLAYDADGVLHFVYYDTVARTLKYATRSAAPGAAARWSKSHTLDKSAPLMGQYASIAIDPVGRPGIAYYDGTNGDLRYAVLDGERWIAARVDRTGTTGLYPSLVFDRSGRAVVSYYDKTNGNLRLGRRSTAGVWSVKTIDGATDNVGRYPSLAVDRNGRLGVAYENARTGDLRYAKENSVGGSWTPATIDRGPSGVPWTSLVFDQSNRPEIGYYDATPGNVKFARYTGTSWATQTVASIGNVGLHVNLVIDSAGRHNLLYFDRSRNRVVRARGSFGSWTFTQLKTGGGQHLAAVATPTGGHVTYTWFEDGTKLLHVAEA